MSFLFLPLTMMVSPLNNCKSSIVAGLSEATELSSELDSSTTKRLGLGESGTSVGKYLSEHAVHISPLLRS